MHSNGDSGGELRARSTLMEAFSGAPVADNESAYDRKHMDRISEKGYVGSFQCGLVHKKTIKIQECMRIPEATAAANKVWEKLQRLLAGGRAEKKVKHKTVVIPSAKKDKKTFHFANLMEFCHLKNAELATHLQKYKW